MPTQFKKNYKHRAPRSSKKQSHSISARALSIIFLIVGLVVTSLIAYPLARIFSGDDGWVVNQRIVLFNLLPLEIPFLGPLSIGQVDIQFYAIFMLAGILSGYFLAIFLAKKSGLSSSVVDKMFLGLLLSGLLGARLVYVIFNFEIFQVNWLDAFNLSKGGLSIFGGFIGAFVYLLIYVRNHKFNLYEILDILGPSILLGQVIGRWGNFFNYEAYGPATGLFWKMYVPEVARVANNYPYKNLNAEFFHPTFLYEIIPNFLLLLLILFFYAQLTTRRTGLVFAIYAVGYGLIRFLTEFFRLDALRIDLPEWLHFSFVAGITFDQILVSQVFAFLLFLMGLFVLLRRRNVLFMSKSMKEVKT